MKSIIVCCKAKDLLAEIKKAVDRSQLPLTNEL
jgi:hypothetical protein